MYDPIEVAMKMLAAARSKGISLSNLQLQKLVYIAHGYLLGWRQRPLISKPVEAWSYGPVIESIYHQFKPWRDQKIPVPPPSLTSSAIDSDADALGVIDGVLNLYGNLGAMELVNLTHQNGTPWAQVWNHHGGNRFYSVEIPDSLIQEHFTKVISNPQGFNGL